MKTFKGKTKATKAQENDIYMAMMRDKKGFEEIFINELPHPKSIRKCQLILQVMGNRIIIRSKA